MLGENKNNPVGACSVGRSCTQWHTLRCCRRCYAKCDICRHCDVSIRIRSCISRRQCTDSIMEKLGDGGLSFTVYREKCAENIFSFERTADRCDTRFAHSFVICVRFLFRVRIGFCCEEISSVYAATFSILFDIFV